MATFDTIVVDSPFEVLGQGVYVSGAPVAKESWSGMSNIGTYDSDMGGKGYVAGNVTEKHTPSNTPVVRRVRLFRLKDGIFLRETWSDASGNYRFDYLPLGIEFFVIAHDHTLNFNAVVKDRITASPM